MLEVPHVLIRAARTRLESAQGVRGGGGDSLSMASEKYGASSSRVSRQYEQPGSCLGRALVVGRVGG